MSVTTPAEAPRSSSTVDLILVIVLATLNLAGLVTGAAVTSLVVSLLMDNEPAGLFGFTMIVYGPLQLLLFIITLIVSIVGVARRRMLIWYIAVTALSLLAVVGDIFTFILAVWA